MKNVQLVKDILINSSNTLNLKLSENIHLINESQLKNSKYQPVCKGNVAYIVGIVLIDEEDKVCLMQETKLSCHGKWYLPAGRMEPDETLQQAAIRECLEETGYLIEPLSLCNVEMDCSSLWFRFTFIARIVGGSLKTVEKADSESLQASWFSLDQLEPSSSFYKDLRSKDFIKIVKIGYAYYKHNKTNSKMSSSASNSFPYSILPQLNSYKQIVFSFIILNKDKTACLLLENNENKETLLPSILLMPDIYLNMYNDYFSFALESILFPTCLVSCNQIKILDLFLLNVDYNATKREAYQTEINHGINFLFLIRIKADSEQILNATIKNYNWFSLQNDNDNNFSKELDKRFEEDMNFIKLIFH